MGVSIPRAKGGAESAEGVAQKIDVDMATADKAGKLQKLLMLDAKENRLTRIGIKLLATCPESPDTEPLVSYNF